MGQVPQVKTKIKTKIKSQFNDRYGIVGDGRVARHISHYFNLMSLPYSPWSRKASGTLDDCDKILILIDDSAIIPFILENGFLRNKKLIHFSGALVTPLADGWHPLMTFGEKLYDLETYTNIPFIGEKGKTSFVEIFPELSNPSYLIASEEKAFYHSLCVMSGNFTTLLWKKLFDELETRFSIPRSAAFPYMNQIMTNVQENPQKSLTGPLNRRDSLTIQKNLDALKTDPFEEIYSAFVKVFFQNFFPKKNRGAPL